ncbi:MAG: class I SAM-dependent methyltransferase [Bryobacteraceae bacterium]|nr:class I SAM-dependent methyltransferase [Bryobacteraceae bacterium]
MECTSCRLIRLYPTPPAHELHTYYPSNYWYTPDEDAVDRLAERYRRFVLRDHVAFVRAALEQAPKEGLLVDVGCGGGLFLQEIGDTGHARVGLDFALGAASVAWHKKNVPAVCAALPQAPLRPESCAAITMFHVLEHLYEPAAYLQSAHQLLHPDGRLIVQVPNAACWQFLLFGEHWNGMDVPRHLIDFRSRDLEALLDHCGFEVLRRKYFSLRDNPAGLATTIAPSLDPMARRIRGGTESQNVKLLKDALYFGLTLASLPFTVLEAACNAGSTVMMEARKKR